jgi:GTP cyclohydrolase IB
MINIHEAKTHFSRLVERAESGEDVIIARSGKPVCKLVAMPAQARTPAKPTGQTMGKAIAESPVRTQLPDAQLQAGAFGGLEWVGMDNVAMVIAPSTGGVVPARVRIGVDLAAGTSRGIHMSRLYLLADQHLQAQSPEPYLLYSLLSAALQSHTGLSQRASVRLSFDLALRRQALASDHSGWRIYPVQIDAQLDAKGFTLIARLQVLYSSTCPSSAALARQSLAEHARQHFAAGADLPEWLSLAANGSVATAHAQRSELHAQFRLNQNCKLIPWTELIGELEACLQTPVQTAVKRIDEQAFAERNGANLMFVEDALRRVRERIERLEYVEAYQVRTAHLESLHAHDAVAEIASTNWA